MAGTTKQYLSIGHTPNGHSRSQMVFSEEIVTPQRAESILDTANFGNRKLDSNRVALYAKAMRTGKWKLSADTLKFDSNNRLQDGQHRLWAVIEAGIPITFAVIRNADPNTFDVLDTGKGRRVTQVLGLMGVTNGGHMASIGKRVLLYDEGKDVQHSGLNPLVLPEDVKSYVIENQEALQLALSRATSIKQVVNIRPNNMAAALYLIQRDTNEPQDRFDEFYEGIRYGAGIPLDDSRLSLRNYRGLAQGRNNYWLNQMEVSIFLKAWNLFVADRPSKLLRFNKTELPMPLVS
jgi:hypothetical protein